MHTTITKQQYQEFVIGLLTGERTQCAQIVRGLLVPEIGLMDIYVNLFQPALYEK